MKSIVTHQTGKNGFKVLSEGQSAVELLLGYKPFIENFGHKIFD